MPVKLLVTLAIALIALPSFGSPTDLEIGESTIRNFEPEEYGGHPQIWSIVQDHRGVMYFATSREILEFDGNRWRRIELHHGSDVRSLTVDDNGTVYVGGNGEIGYLAADLLGELVYRSLKEHVPEKDRGFREVDFTLATSHGIYFCTQKALLRWHDGQITALYPKAVESIVPAKVGDSIYFYTSRGIAKIKDGSISVLPGSILPAENAGSVFAFPFVDSNHILLGSKKLGLFLYSLNSSPAHADYSPFKPFAEALTPYLAENPLDFGLALLNGDRIAIGSRGGGIVIVNRRGELTQVINENRGLLSDTVYSLFSDAGGNLWAGLMGGISHIATSSPLTLFGKRSGLTSTITAVTRHQNRIYAGSYANGPKLLPPYQLSPKDDKHLFISPTGEKKERAFDFLSLGKTLVVASNPVRVIDDSVIRDIENAPLAYDLSLSKRFDRYIFLSPTTANGSGVGIIEVTPSIPDVVSQNLSPTFKYVGKLEGIDETVRKIVPDDDGNLWLATHLSGLIHVRFRETDIEHPEITRYSTKDGLPAINLNNIYLNRESFLVGTQKGIYRAIPPRDTAKGRFRFEPATDLNQSYGNLEEPVGEIAGYSKGALILAFPRRSTILLEKSGDSYRADFRTFRSIMRQTIGLHVDPDGVIWIPSVNGLYRYDPSIEKDYESPYAAIIRRVKTNLGREIFKGTYFDGKAKKGNYFPRASSTQPKELVPTLAYEENGFTFEYSTLFFEHMDYIHYRVRLQGFDADWSDWSADVKKEYTNIPEGNYVFQVRAKNIYDFESKIAEYRFIVKPPWYRTWGAYLGYGVLFLLAVYGSSFLFRRRLIAAKNKLEQLVKERTHEIIEQKYQIEQQKEELLGAYQEVSKTKDALWGEMELAKKIQTVLLPHKPRIPGYELAAYMQPCDEVGGDYYDVIEAGGIHWIVIGDVSGHGVPAGIVMMMVQTAIHSVLKKMSGEPPSEILTTVNSVICENLRLLDDDKYMTITVMTCGKDGRFYYSGLHLDILIFRAQTERVEVVETNGIWLGVWDDINDLLKVETLTLNPGDTMLLYTDGITEARDEAGQMYSSPRLASVFNDIGGRSAFEIGQGILSTLNEYTCDDDVTFIVIKRNSERTLPEK